MEEPKKELSMTIWAGTPQKLDKWKKDIWDTIGAWTINTTKEQITIKMEKREKEEAKKRSHDN